MLKHERDNMRHQCDLERRHQGRTRHSMAVQQCSNASFSLAAATVIWLREKTTSGPIDGERLAVDV